MFSWVECVEGYGFYGQACSTQTVARLPSATVDYIERFTACLFFTSNLRPNQLKALHTCLPFFNVVFVFVGSCLAKCGHESTKTQKTVVVVVFLLVVVRIILVSGSTRPRRVVLLTLFGYFHRITSECLLPMELLFVWKRLSMPLLQHSYFFMFEWAEEWVNYCLCSRSKHTVKSQSHWNSGTSSTCSIVYS